MNIPFSPPDISELEVEEVAEALRSGWITTGPRVKLLERRLAAYIDTGKTDIDCNTEENISKYSNRVVCLNSATAAEELNFRICGIGEGDEVIVPAYTYTATASAAIHCGAKVIFVDSQKDSTEMDYDKVAEAITEKTKAIVAVDLGGIVADTVLESNVQLGVAENFQKGLLHCECDYVFFADQDDVWLPNKISTFIDIMERNDVAFAFSNAEIVDENLNSVNKSLWESINYSQEKAYCIYEKEDYRFVKELIRHNIVTGMCMCARKDLVNKIVPFDSEVLHDTWIAMNAALKVKTIAIAQKLVLYRQHQGNVIGTNTGIGKKLSRSSSYYLRVLNRKKMIKMIIDSNNIHNNEIKELLNNYYNFQIHRLQFMKRHLGFLWAIKNRERYLKLASDGKDILIKDYFIRITGLLERGKE